MEINHYNKNSLTPKSKRKILTERELYHINGIPLGTLFFKLLTQNAIIDTWVTSSLIQENLSIWTCII